MSTERVIGLTATRLVLLLSGFCLPIALSWLRFIPWPDRLVAIVNAYIIDPALWSKRHKTPLPGNVGLVPSRGQALFILYFILLNIFFCALGYHNVYPNTKYTTKSIQTMHYLENRLGVLGLANMSLIVLYSGRNNILLHVTNWQHSTFLLMHRWVCIDP